MAPRFEIVQDSSGKFAFQFKDRNGQVQLSSLAYDGKINVQREVAHVRSWLGDDQRVVRHARPTGDHFFTLKNDHGEVIARSTMAGSEHDLERLVASLRVDVASASLTDTTSSRRRVGSR